MLTPEEKQKDFFDEYVYANLIPRDHELQAIARKVDFSFVEKEIADLYSQNTGRPAYPAGVLFRMLFLEYYANLSDVEVSRQCQYNLLYRSFIGLGINEPTPDDTTLVVFRRRLGEERFERIFNLVVEQCQKQGLLEERLKIVDATHVIANIAVPNTVNLLRQARQQVIKAIEKEARTPRPDLRQCYQTEQPIYHKPSSEVLTREVNLSQKLVQEVKGNYGEGVKEKVGLLEKILDPQPKEKLTSVIDTDARFGHKTPSKTFVGYKVHIAEDTSDIVTSVSLLGGNENEGVHLVSLLQGEEARGLRQDGVAADALYDSATNRQYLFDRGIQAYIPFGRQRKQVQQFNYLHDKDALLCPVGEQSISRTRQERGTLHVFSTHQCQYCFQQSQCVPLNNGRARVWLSDNYKHVLRIPVQGREKAEKERKRIERKFGEAKQWHALGRARYWGKAKVAIQAFLTFLVLNTKRIVKLLSFTEKSSLNVVG
jgi:IS5 family transposase